MTDQPRGDLRQAARTVSRGAMLKLLLGLAISGCFLYAVLRVAPLTALLGLLSQARLPWIALSVAAVGLAYAVKIERWAAMLRSLGSRVSARQATIPLLSGVALNNILPFRAGDAARVVGFQKLTGAGASFQLGAVILERLLDLVTLLALLVLTLAVWRVARLDPLVVAGLQVTAVVALAALVATCVAPRPLLRLLQSLRFRWRWLDAALRAGVGLLEAMSRLARPALLARLLLLSFVAWLFEGAAYFAAARSLAMHDSIPVSILSLELGTLSTALPSSPGYVGTFHYFVALSAKQFGTTAADAAAYALLIHAILWLSTTSAGMAALAMANRVSPAGPTPVAASPEGRVD